MSCGGGGGGGTNTPTNVAPAITTQPQPQTVKAGATATFSGAATGTPTPTLQWKKNGSDISGATSASYTTPATAKADNGAKFSFAATNAAGSVTSNEAALTVQWLAIATQPSDQTVQEGQTATFTVVADANPAPSYQWQKGGTEMAGAISDKVTIQNVKLSDADTYLCLLTNAFGSLTSNPAKLTVTPKPVAPSITTQPKSATVQEKNSVSFNVVATGTAPLNFQWKFNENALAGATSEKYTMPSVQLSDSGDYTVDVSNVAGKITSDKATLTVTPAPVGPTITSQPKDASVQEGNDAAFSVTATGTAPLSFKWQKNSVEIAGAISNDLILKMVQMVDSGNHYHCVVSNAVATVNSTEATLTVTPAPKPPVIQSFTATPATITLGQSAQLAWSVTGANSLLIDNGVGDVTGKTETTVTPASHGEFHYELTATNAVGSVKATTNLKVNPKNRTTLTVNLGTGTTGSPATSQDYDEGAVVSYSYSLRSEYKDLVVKLDGSPVSATGTVTMSASHTLDVSATADPAPIVFTTHPQNRTVVEGDSTTFGFVATGSNPRTYQWQKDSVDIPGATSADYTMNTTLADNGKKFRVVVTNPRGSYPSNEATLTVTERPVAPTFTANLPATLTLNQGQSQLFSVSANGTAPLTVVWYKGSSVWPAMNMAQMNQMAAETSTFTKSYTADLADNGSDVWCVVTNSAGNLMSVKCRLTINPALAPHITDFTATPSTSTPGAPVQLLAHFENGTGIVNPGNLAIKSGTPITVNPTATMKYTLTVTNGVGASVTADANVTVGPIITIDPPSGSVFTTSQSVTVTITATPPTGKSISRIEWWWKRPSTGQWELKKGIDNSNILLTDPWWNTPVGTFEFEARITCDGSIYTQGATYIRQ